MKIREILEDEKFARIKKEVDLYAEKMLTDYTQNLSIQSGNVSEKEIFDAVWGPVEFNPGEIALLDSPLIQRLRKIKQLGLASYVYCEADYSRFSHTVGVFYLSGRMAQIIQKQLKGIDEKYNFVQIVRLAAIFHDAGHMYFSHVSERYFTENERFSRYNEVKSMLMKMQTLVNSRVPLHEVLGIMLLQTKAVKDLIRKVIPYLDGINVKTENDLDEILEYMSCLIIGQAVDEKILPYYQIINGPVDADKCDYLSRDSHATNVPVAVDIFRLIHKLNIEKMEKCQIPENVYYNNKIWEGDLEKVLYYPTIKSSAIEALSQLVMARAIMYNSVYYHQKVRTVETMLERVLEGLDALKISAVNDFTQILLLTDDAFGYYCYQIFNSDAISDKRSLQKWAEELNKINFRMLLKRASIIAIEYVKASEETSYVFEKDILKLNKRDKFEEIEKETKEEYRIICNRLGKSDKSELTFLIMGFPSKMIGGSIPDAVISYGNGEVKKAADIFQTGTWIESRDSKNINHYLLTNCENRELAFLALQKVLFRKYDIILKPSAARCAKVSHEEIKKIQKSLLSKDYYNDSLILLSNIFFENLQNKIESVCKKYQTFEGKRGKTITDKILKNFIKQFMYLNLSEENIKSLIDGILRILENGIYIDRGFFSESLETVFNKISTQNETIFLCPLGGEKDSAHHLLYYLNDLHDNQRIVTTKSLQEALDKSKPGQRLVFFDDGAYSGMQVSSIIEEYMGVPEEERATKEKHVMPLNQDERDEIQKRKISIAYICFNAKNEHVIREHAEKAGLNLENIVYMKDMQKKLFDESSTLFASPEQRQLVKECFAKIGYEILNSVKQKDGIYKLGWSKKRIEEGALGYNDAQQAVILKSSVPTYTLTAFWLSGGRFNGREWVPLFIRTDK